MKELFTSFLVEILSAGPAATGKKYASSAKQWMTESEDVTADIREALRVIGSRSNSHPTGLAKMFGEFLNTEVSQVMDELADGQTVSKEADRLKLAIRRWAAKKLPETAQREVAEAVRTLLGYPTAWVRSATLMPEDLRAKIRKELADKYVIFNIDENLLGGMQIVSEGKTLDASWLGRIKSWNKVTA